MLAVRRWLTGHIFFVDEIGGFERNSDRHDPECPSRSSGRCLVTMFMPVMGWRAATDRPLPSVAFSPVDGCGSARSFDDKPGRGRCGLWAGANSPGRINCKPMKIDGVVARRAGFTPA